MTQETALYNYSDASSIGRFPSFNFSLHLLMPLAILYVLSWNGKGSCKVFILAVVLGAMIVDCSTYGAVHLCATNLVQTFFHPQKKS